ncbi:hypothetical protein SS50377_28244 [Spironucleus salmonicida]|uniref:Uncharacterized protein n=1 Tax=Spironucleus salmonicida TaxID=348837 RepID=V6LV19_9EUKA|nr:hypothetical protein SS50377_28244 [Spironucleus salmonicida]|eukprot:EST48425.1 Hypothetical protein SS50377_11373 [Spironucleus salmonicida]
MSDQDYDKDLSSARFAVQSVVINDILKDKEPISTQCKNYLYISSKTAKLVIKLQIENLGEDRSAKYEEIMLNHEISQFITTEDNVYYVSGETIYDLSNQINLEFDQIFCIDTIQIDDTRIVALVQKDYHYYWLTTNFETVNGPVLSNFDIIKTVSYIYQLCLITQKDEQVYLYQVKQFDQVELIASIVCTGIIIGIIDEYIFFKHTDTLEKINILTQDSEQFETNVFSVEILPTFPHKTAPQYIILNNEDIVILDQNFRTLQLINNNNFIPPTSTGMDKLVCSSPQLDPDLFIFIKNTAHSLNIPILNSERLKQIAINIKGCQEPQFLNQEGNHQFKQKDYYYIMITCGYESNGASIHFFSVNALSRNDKIGYQYPWSSLDSRAPENVKFRFSEVVKVQAVQNYPEESEQVFYLNLDTQQKIQSTNSSPPHMNQKIQLPAKIVELEQNHQNQKIQQQLTISSPRLQPSNVPQIEFHDRKPSIRISTPTFNAFAQVSNQLIAQTEQIIPLNEINIQNSIEFCVVFDETINKNQVEFAADLFLERTKIPYCYYKLINSAGKQLCTAADITRFQDVKRQLQNESINETDDVKFSSEKWSVESSFVGFGKCVKKLVNLSQMEEFVKKLK